MERVLALGGDEAPALRVLALAQFGWAALFLGDEAAAAAAGEQALAESRARRDATGEAYALNLLAAVAWNRDDLDQAEGLVAEALALSRQGDDPAVVALSLNNLGLSAALRGDHDGALARYEEGITLWRELGEGSGLAQALCNFAWLLRKRGDTRRAAAMSREALAATWDLGAQWTLVPLLGDAAAVAVTVGHSERAARLLSAAARLLDRMGTPVMTMDQAAYARNLTAIRAALGETAFQAAWAEGEALPLTEAVAEAHVIFAEEEAQASGGVVPPPASDPVALSGLSLRELEVVRLIATGSSNQDIADALFISHRTASTHVRNILTKLNLDNRVAVASWATRHHLA